MSQDTRDLQRFLRALTHQDTRGTLAQVAEHLGLEEAACLSRLAVAAGLTPVRSEALQGHELDLQRLPLARAQQLECLLLQRRAGEPWQDAVIGDPLANHLITQLEALAQGPLRFLLATPADIRARLKQQEHAPGHWTPCTDHGNR
ncbi:hypothetical protein [Ideonella sp. B508-1]|uniref:GspE/PulE/PilB domain-containing protein n=1 Tax=Ideonella sp. B508-1 TaxID=137716 RepID=UPI000347D6B8|nr:hypothetical protein [Ideonella sp. B508-1]